MHCPFCGHDDTKVIDSRVGGDGLQVRRRRECLKCTERFSTFEGPVLKLPNVIKSDGSREAFSEDKLRAGIQRALEKRPVETEKVEEAIAHIVKEARSSGVSEVPSRLVGEWVMEALRALDQVAYVRFASVYRRFEDVQAFREEIEKLESEMPTSLEARQLPLLGNGRR